MFKLSIIICSFNRSTELEQLLEDINQQYELLNSDEQKEIELILVDNNSFDNTKEIIYHYIESTALSVKFFTETQLGLSHARNLAISKASGDLLAFLHDDINLDDDWLQEALRLGQNANEEEIGVYGGRIVPLWQSETPSWLNINDNKYPIQQRFLNIHSYGDQSYSYPFETEAGVVEFPCGTHVFIRKDVFDNCGLFRTDLGPSAAGGLEVAEDFEFFQYLNTLKIPMIYVPQAMVFQVIKPHQLKLQYIRREHFKFARAKYWIKHSNRLKKDTAPQNHTMTGLQLKFLLFTLAWLLSLFSFNNRLRHWLSFQISSIMGQMDAITLLQEKISRKKFSFAKTNQAESYSITN
jgi:glucosyl-dolichyl phosphate glucuronosyltransferase